MIGIQSSLGRYADPIIAAYRHGFKAYTGLCNFNRGVDMVYLFDFMSVWYCSPLQGYHGICPQGVCEAATPAFFEDTASK